MSVLRLSLTVLCLGPVLGCSSQAPPNEQRESGLAVVQLPDASLVSAEQLEFYRHELASAEQPGEIDGRAPADRFGQLGKRLFADGFESAAESCFLNARGLDPERFEWVYYLAHLYAVSGKTQDAVASFQIAMERRPDDVAPKVSLGNVFLAAGRLQEAVTVYEEALAIDPDSASALYGLGRALLARDDHAASLQALARALELAPRASAIHYPLAQAARGAGREALAEEHLEQRGDVEVFPFDPLMEEIRTGLGNPVVLNERGRAAFARGEFEAAVAAFRRVVETTDNQAWAHANLASALFRNGDADAAAEALRYARTLAPADPGILFGLGAIAESRSDVERAEGLYRAALATEPEYTAASVRLAHLLRASGRHVEAVEHYTTAISADPRHAVAQLGRAMSWVKLQRWVQARDALEGASRSLPDQPAFAHAWARILASAPDETVRDGVRALQILDGLIQAGQNDSDLGESLAMALAEAGAFERARSIQTQILTLARDSADPAIVAGMTARLQSYERNQPWREPWPTNHPLHLPPADASPDPPRRARPTP